MNNHKRQLQDPEALLKLMDEYYTALYHQVNDPQRPTELAHRISRYFRPADLPNSR